jgi:hypothetical protein
LTSLQDFLMFDHLTVAPIVTGVPEPETVALLGVGLVALMSRVARRKSRNAAR